MQPTLTTMLQRVIQYAQLHAQSSGQKEVDTGQMLAAIFRPRSRRRSSCCAAGRRTSSTSSPTSRTASRRTARQDAGRHRRAGDEDERAGRAIRSRASP